MKLVMECGPCDGDLGYAKACVDEIAQHLGVAMKVQIYSADRLAALYSPRYDRTDDRPMSQHDLFQNQLTYDQWAEVAEYARSQDVEFFASVFDFEAIEMAYRMGIRTFKIASGDITYLPLIRQAANHLECDIVVSTGATTLPEVEAVMGCLPQYGSRRLTLLACHLAYPTEPRDANLHRVRALKRLFGDTSNIGYSDHTPGLDVLPVLVTLGATMWEKHFSARPRVSHSEGDHHFAIRPDMLAEAIDIINDTRVLLGPREFTPTPRELAARHGARRSLATTQDIPSGTRLTRDNTTFLRPASGYSPSDAELVYGARTTRDIHAGSVITPDMLT